MKEKFLINARIIDPKNQVDEIGGLIIDVNGKIKAIGKKVANGNLPTEAEKINLKKQILIPGINTCFFKFIFSADEGKFPFATFFPTALINPFESIITPPISSIWFFGSIILAFIKYFSFIMFFCNKF